ncbi:sugar transporter [Ruegeria marina]|uniref:sugar transporter n=1 Tax=Ruegeria marina TaxID=639004 RepID=UPI001FE20F2B|nr:sugar transporter [Ruegeria marina]
MVRPVASPATVKRRHWGLMASFGLLVLMPLLALAFYLWVVADDQYSSTTGFIVRSDEGEAASEMLGGLAQLAGANTASDSDILYEFIQSQEIVEEIDSMVDLRAHYSAGWPRDFLFTIWPDATLEDLVWYWQRVVRISYDRSSGLTEVRVLAFDRETARTIAAEIVRLSQELINDLNVQAREDALRYARADLDDAIARLKLAREEMTRFRTRTRIVDPVADLQGRMGVMNNLQQQLATALIEYDLLRDTVSASDPRVTNAERMIEVIRERIAIERQTFASSSTETGAVGEDYPSLLAEFESLTVDMKFAEETYRAALTALDLARANAARQSRYLATYIDPTLADDSEFPRRFVLIGLAGLFFVMLWSILALVYYSIRDRG